MSAKNDVTGDVLKTKATTQEYADGWERIFGNKQKKQEEDDKKSQRPSRETLHKNV